MNHGEDDFVVYRSVTKISDVHAKFIQDKLDTMEKVFCSAVSQHKNKPALGTRVIISEEDEMQPDGKIFKKVTFLLKTMHSNKISNNSLFSSVPFGWFSMADLQPNE